MDLPVYAFVLLAIIPTIATVVSLGRHIFGFNSFNIYVPVVTSLVFIEMGLFSGILISLLVFLTTVYSRKILMSFRMHYYVRISTIYTLVCFLLFGLLFFLSYLSTFTTLNVEQYLNLEPIIPIILMVTLVEEFFTTVVKEGESKVSVMFLETLAISIIAFFVIRSNLFTNILFESFWVLLLLFPLNVLLARYEGLRFSELLRFKSVIVNEMRRLEEEEQEGSVKKKKKKKKKVSKKEARRFSTKLPKKDEETPEKSGSRVFFW